MPNIIRDATISFLMPALKDFASDPVIYVRPRTGQSVQIQATYGQKLLRLHDQFGGVRIEWTDLDFIIAAADLHFDDGILIKPERHDEIYLTVASGEVQVYEVFPFGFEPPWRWSGVSDLLYRIHTKNTRTVQPYT